MNTLEFDIDKLNNMKTTCTTLSKEIEDSKKALFDDLEMLKSNWQTDAGKKFFEELDTNWVSHVEKYKQVAEEIEKLLDVAIKEYSTLVEEAKAIKL